MNKIFIKIVDDFERRVLCNKKGMAGWLMPIIQAAVGGAAGAGAKYGLSKIGNKGDENSTSNVQSLQMKDFQVDPYYDKTQAFGYDKEKTAAVLLSSKRGFSSRLVVSSTTYGWLRWCRLDEYGRH